MSDFVKVKFWPAVLEYLGNLFPKYRTYSVHQVERSGWDYWNLELEDRIGGELAYDLFGSEILAGLPQTDFRKIWGKRHIGSVIRFCKAMNKQDLAGEIYRIVENYLTPDTYQDPKDSFRATFGLNVEPSTGGFQCSCCKEE